MRGGGTGVGFVLAVAMMVPRAAPAANGPYLTARAAIVVDASSGDVVFERSADTPLPPASTTKVLTAIVALESGRLDDELRVSEDAAETPPSKLGLPAGQRRRLRHLIYAVLLNSANDAAEVVAEGLAGSDEAFAARMNQKARAIGAVHSHFENPHGLTAEGHVATARDLATIFRYGMQLPLFRSILETRTIQVPVESVGVHTVALRSHNRLLTGYAYPVIGKTGYTRPARRCFVGAATRGEREVVVALLGASDLWGDARRLIQFGLGEPERPAVVMAGMLPMPHLGRRTKRHRARPVVHVASEGDDDATADRAPAAAYAVQLGPYDSSHGAAAERARLARQGYTASALGRVLQLGHFTSRSRASQLASRLRIKGFRPTIVALR